MKKKLLALFVSILFVFSAVASMAVLAEEVVDAGYTYDEATDTYTVTTADGLIAVAAAIDADNFDANITLAADIDLTGKTWTPLVAKSPGYSGTIDGAGYKISGLSVSGAARTGFISRGNSCTVKNLTFVDPVVASTAEYNGIIIGDITYAIDGVPAVIENCHIINGKVTGTRYSGAVVGATAPADLIIRNCTIDADVENSKDNAAMILGGDRGACKNILFENLVITGSATSPLRGGLTGYVCDSKITFKNVVSFAEVSVAGTNVSGLMGQAKRNVLEISNVIVPGSPLSILDAYGENKVDTITISNLFAVADGAAVTLLDGDSDPVISDATQATITIDGKVIETTVDAWKAATVPAISGAEAVGAKIRDIFAGNAALKLAALAAAGIEANFADINGYDYDEAADTYTVYTADGFIAVADDINSKKNGDATIILAADIDMDGKAFPVICLDNSAHGYFSGVIDGAGHKISNLAVSVDGVDRVGGLVGQSAGGTFKNLIIVDASVTAKTYVSLFIGDARSGKNTITFDNCHVINPKITATASYAAVFATTNTCPIEITNCSVINADVSAASSHAGILFNDRGSASDLAINIENMIITGKVSATTNAGAVGYMCDSKISLTNVVSLVEAKNATNASALLSNAKRSGVTMNNVITIGSPIASADALGEKVVNDINVNNVFVVGANKVKLFKSFGINGTKPVNYNGTAVTDLADIVVDALTCDAATLKAVEFFANNETLKDIAATMFVHDYTNEVVDDKYLVTPATCTAKATYYKSCMCGAVGTDTFEGGELAAHVFDKEVATDAYLAKAATCTEQGLYYKSCVCGLAGEETFAYGELAPHVFDQQISGDDYLVTPATCTTSAVYYVSCECGLKGEDTFVAVGALGHLYGDWTVVTEPTTDAEGLREKVCSDCGDKITEAIAKLPVVEEPKEPTFIDTAKDTVVDAYNTVKDKVTELAGGCSGSIGGTSIIIMIAAAGAVIARKKKED